MKKINSENLIVNTLRSEIESGALRPGQPLLQDELALRFNVSRVPVRDAIKALESSGLITLRPNRTAQVTSLDIAEVEEIFSIRIMLECDLIKRATVNASASDHFRVQEISGMLDKVRTGERFAALDRELHAALYTPADLHRQFDIVARLGQLLARYYGSALKLKSYHGECQGGHRQIVDAFVDGSPRSAATHLKRHLQIAKAKILKSFIQKVSQDA